MLLMDEDHIVSGLVIAAIGYTVLYIAERFSFTLSLAAWGEVLSAVSAHSDRDRVRRTRWCYLYNTVNTQTLTVFYDGRCPLCAAGMKPLSEFDSTI